MSERCPHCRASLERLPVRVPAESTVVLKPSPDREVVLLNSTAHALRVTAESVANPADYVRSVYLVVREDEQ